MSGLVEALIQEARRLGRLYVESADEITRLTARVAELEGGIKKALDIHKRNFGHQTEKLADIAPILRDALEPKR